MVSKGSQDTLDDSPRGDMVDVSLAGSLAADVEAGDGLGVAAQLGGQFLFAMEDPMAGALDDDGDELADVAGPKFDGLLVDHDPAAGVHPAPGGDRSGWQRRGGRPRLGDGPGSVQARCPFGGYGAGQRPAWPPSAMVPEPEN
jgi:hypothetical protein